MTSKIVIVLPTGSEQYAEDINMFVAVMIEKLHKHRGKGHWDNININEALARMHEETEELAEAIKDENYTEIHREAADVANFALILSSVLRRRHRNTQLEMFIDG
tara:strand:- start:230 stop:544 length:315 start_codon:yes stop_codon:yes gene_type:complete